LGRILASPEFLKAKRSSRLLQFLVERTLDGKTECLKEYVIAVEAFERDETFDPRIDSLVRVEAVRLRARLKAFYARAGAGGLRIDLHAGSYIPVFIPPEKNLAKQNRTTSSGRRLLWLAGLTASFVFLSAAMWVQFAQSRISREIHVFNAHRLTAYSGISAYGALGPGSKWLICSSDRGGDKELHLWKYSLEGGEPVQLTSGPQRDTAPAVSPDGKWIAFESDSKPAGIYLIPSSGGERRLVAPAGLGPRFSPDGQWLAYWMVDPGSTFGRVFIAPIGRAGEPVGIAREFDDAHTPLWAPNGRGLFICGTRRTQGGPTEEHDFWYVPPEGRDAIKTGAFAWLAKAGVDPHVNLLGRTSFEWFETGVLFPGSSGGRAGLWWLPLSTRTWRVDGKPVPITLSTEQQVHPSFQSGTIAFTSASVLTNLWSVPLDANEGRATGEAQQLTDEGFDHLCPSISTDGSALVFLSASHALQLQACKKGLAGEPDKVLSRPDQTTNRLKISPDGRTAYYRVLEGAEPQRQAIYSVDLATARSTCVCRDCGAPTHVSPDGNLVIFETGSAIARLAAVRVDTGEKREFAWHPHHGMHSARVSPNGRWIAFHLDRGWDGKQIFVAPFRDAKPIKQDDWIPVTEAGGIDQEAWWSPNSQYLYFLSDRDGRRCVWAQKLDYRSGKPIGSATSIYHLHEARLTPLTFLWRSPLYVGLSVARDHLVLSLAELSSSIWIGSLKR
jgi:Tol biopolymer transport system component